jgi:DNA-binding transcriptional ArsR family regulator
MELLRAVSDPAFCAGSITNKGLRAKLAGTPWAKEMSDKQLSGRVSRHLVLLREHGLIEKLPKQRKYTLTESGAPADFTMLQGTHILINSFLALVFGL